MISRIEAELDLQIRGMKLPKPEPEFRFHPVRRWKFDRAWPDIMLAVECEGLNPRGKSRHLTIKGFTEDCVKYNEAAMLGWTVLRFTGNQVKDGYAIQTLERALKNCERMKVKNGILEMN